jgi:hypothetical protein
MVRGLRAGLAQRTLESCEHVNLRREIVAGLGHQLIEAVWKCAMCDVRGEVVVGKVIIRVCVSSNPTASTLRRIFSGQAALTL